MFCSFDSGIFSMKFMEIWSPRIILSNQFTGQNINNIRVQYANQMFFHPNNKMLQTEVENVVVNWFDSVSFFFFTTIFFLQIMLYTLLFYLSNFDMFYIINFLCRQGFQAITVLLMLE